MFKIGDKVKFAKSYFDEQPHEKIYDDMIFEVVEEDPLYGVTNCAVKEFFGQDAHLVFNKDYHPDDGGGFGVIYTHEMELV